MFRGGKVLLVIIAVVLLCGIPMTVIASEDDIAVGKTVVVSDKGIVVEKTVEKAVVADKPVVAENTATAGKDIAGTIVGRTGDILDIDLSQPVREGSIISVKPSVSEPEATKATVVSCTIEEPYIALAKVLPKETSTENAVAADKRVAVDNAVAASKEMGGTIVGRTGDILHISLPQSVHEGSIISVKPVVSEPEATKARVVSCTKEEPYIALAKIIPAETTEIIPIGSHVYADATQPARRTAPEPEKKGRPSDNQRFSIQAGAFYPTTQALRDQFSGYWQAYRLNYSMLKMNFFELMLSGEYTKGDNSFVSKGVLASRSMEIVPVTALGKLKLARLGNAHFFIGAGAGAYSICTKESVGAISTTDTQHKFGHEFTAGLESSRGWIFELRYRDIQDTDIKGYSLTLGGRF